MYNINWVKEEYNKNPDVLKYIFFWGHQANRDGSMGKGCLSQWWMEDFVVDGITYHSAEHWMMAGKARLFKDEEMLQAILAADNPGKAKKLGRKVRNFNDKVWKANCFELVTQGNVHKFSQNEEMKTYLLNTQKRILVEASPYDRIWGIGLAANTPNINNPYNWKGSNLLGFALMEARDRLR